MATSSYQPKYYIGENTPEDSITQAQDAIVALERALDKINVLADRGLVSCISAGFAGKQVEYITNVLNEAIDEAQKKRIAGAREGRGPKA